MTERIERELHLPVSAQALWDAITADGWLADEVELELVPGGEARFTTDGRTKHGWVEAASPARRLTFWWSCDDEPATRVEITLTPLESLTRLRVVEARPLELLDLVGTPLSNTAGRRFGPALVAA